MAELVFVVLCIAGAFALAMRQAPLWAWAAGAWRPPPTSGSRACCTASSTSRSSASSACSPGCRWSCWPGCRVPAVAACRADRAALPQDQGHPAQGLGHRAGGAQRRHHRLRCRAVLRHARLGEAARRSADHADRGGEGVPRRARRTSCAGWSTTGRSATTSARSPSEIWDFVKKHGFLGMLISKEHGGLGFSPQAQSLVLGKIASRSPDVCTIVMVPNSLGPGELIEKYGTPEQKEHYLPRLAKGLEVPCFSLTGPTSGSDAATMRDVGYVTKGRHEGKEVVGIRAVLGEALHHAGAAARRWSASPSACSTPRTCWAAARTSASRVALIPADHPGVEIGRRHLPSRRRLPERARTGARDVFIPMDWVIGGEKMVGQGWRMLMECLAAGRSISLPSSSAAGAKSLLRNYLRLCPHPQAVRPADRQDGGARGAARAHGRERLRQRGRARRHGVDGEPRREAVGDLGHHEVPDDRAHAPLAQRRHGPARRPRHLRRADQLSAWRPTRRCRWRSRSRAPTSSRARSSPSRRARCARIPISTRRSRPARTPTRSAGSTAFDTAFCGHVAFSLSNMFGAFFHNITFGLFGHVPEKAYGTAEWYRQLWRASRNFAFVADLTVAVLGGGLKTKQKLTGRLADALSELYLLSLRAEALRGRRQAGQRPPHRGAVPRSNGLFRFQEALRGTIDNFPVAPVRWLMRAVVFPFGAHYKPAPDWLGHKVGRAGAGARRGARPAHALHLRLERSPTIRPALLEVTFAKVGGRRGGREEARPRRARRPGAPRARHRLDRRRGQAGRHHRRARRSCCARSSS